MIKKDIKTIPLISNTMFKEVFGSEENKEAIAYLISEYFSLEYDAVLNNIKFKNTKLNINNEKDYKYDVDIIVSIDNETIVNLEANKSMWPGEENRNMSYLFNIFSSQFKRGTTKEDFRNAKKCIQINFNKVNYPKDREKSISKLIDVETKEEITDIIEIHHVNLEVIKKRCYNKKEEELTPIERIGLLLISESSKEIEGIVGEEMDSLLDKIMELSNDENLLGLYDKEELEEEIRRSIKSEATKEGIREGMEQGIQEGIQMGIEQNKVEIAKKMLKDNIDMEMVSKYTGFSIEELTRI